MFFVLGKITWTHVLTHQGPWDPTNAVAWCVWTAFATLAGIGIIRPVKMLPIVLLEIFYKVQWLILVAYPLWSKGTLAGSPAEDITSPFLWVILPIVAVPWGYVFVNYFYQTKKVEAFLERGRKVRRCSCGGRPNDFLALNRVFTSIWKTQWTVSGTTVSRFTASFATAWSR